MIVEHPEFGDECHFIKIAEKVQGYTDFIILEPNKRYEVCIYYHNNADEQFNSKANNQRGIARNTKLSVNLPKELRAGEKGEIQAAITSENTNPASVWSKIDILSLVPIVLCCVENSCKIQTYNKDWDVNGKQLSEFELFSEEGTFLGVTKLNGTIRGGEKYAGKVIFEFQTSEKTNIVMESGTSVIDMRQLANGSENTIYIMKETTKMEKLPERMLTSNNKKRNRKKQRVTFIGLGVVLVIVAFAGIFLTRSESNVLSESFFDSAVQGDTFFLGEYEQDNNLNNGAEDIEWTVVSNQNGLILAVSKYCLEIMPYNAEKFEAVNWEDCTLRQWLNGEFYNVAFTDDDKSWICKTNLQNLDAQYYQIPGGYNTVDSIFLLGCSDIKSNYEGYGFGLLSMGHDEADGKMIMTMDTVGDEYKLLQAEYTNYAKEAFIQAQAEAVGGRTENEARAMYESERYGYWWLRTPGDQNYSAMCISPSGGAMSLVSHSTVTGVCPAILVRKDRTSIPNTSDEAGADAVLENGNGKLFVEGTDQAPDKRNISATQLLFREQSILCVLSDGRVLRTAYDGNELLGWSNIQKTVAAGNVMVGLTVDGKVLLSPEGKEIYGVDVLPHKDVVDVCICPEATNSDEEKKGCIIVLTKDGTAYFTYADGSGFYQDDVQTISAYDNKFSFVMNDGSVHGEKYNETGWGYGDVLKWSDIVQVACGENFIAGLKSDGSIVVSGGCLSYGVKESNDITNGDIGLGISSVEFDLTGWNDIVSISAGRSHLVGLKSDGTVISAGLNNYSQCDTGDWSDVVNIEASNNTTIGYCSDGSIFLAGKDIISNMTKLQNEYTAYLWYTP